MSALRLACTVVPSEAIGPTEGKRQKEGVTVERIVMG